MIIDNGATLKGQALVSDQAASRLAPSGFDPSRGHFVQSVSGGIASAASAILGHHMGLSQSLVMADTTIEEPDLYRFANEVAEAIGQSLTILRDGRDPYDVFVDRKFIGNSRTAHCSDELKTKQVRRWMRQNVPDDATLLLGMYLDEADRLDRAAKNWAPYKVDSLLILHRVYPGIARKIVTDMGLRTPALYDEGFPHDNCGGGCVRAGQGQWATLLARRPETYAWHEQRLNWAMEQIGPTARPFLRIWHGNDIEYVTLTTFRERIEAGTLKPKMHEMGGCGCFVDMFEAMGLAA